MRIVSLCIAVFGLAGAVSAQEKESSEPPPSAPSSQPLVQARLHKVMVELKHAPSVIEVQRQSMRYFRLHPERIEELRRTVLSRAWLPQVQLSGDVNKRSMDEFYRGAGGLSGFDSDTDTRDLGFRVGGALNWNFPGTVFDPSLLQTYALTAIQMNMLKEVTRLYYVRNQLLLGLRSNPPSDPTARAAMEMRILEFTALIDAFTGGWFSRAIEDMAKRAAGGGQTPAPGQFTRRR